MRRVGFALALVLTTSLTAAACAPADDAGDDSTADATTDTMAAAPAPTPAGAAAERPDTTAESVWAHLQDVDYRSWRMWPGKSELYTGGEPHGMLLTTYLNDIAYEALTSETGPLPDGSIVVKENFTPDSTLDAVTVMYAVDGYNPDHANWFWAKYGTDGGVQAAGRVDGCQECHASGDRGYLRTALGGGAGGGRE